MADLVLVIRQLVRRFFTRLGNVKLLISIGQGRGRLAEIGKRRSDFLLRTGLWHGVGGVGTGSDGDKKQKDEDL